MADGNLRQYQVDYLVNTNAGSTVQIFKELSEAAKAAETPLLNLKRYLDIIQKHIKGINATKGNVLELKIEPRIDMKLLKDQLKLAQAEAQTTANAIATQMNNAMAGVKTQLKKDLTRLENAKEAASKNKKSTKKSATERTMQTVDSLANDRAKARNIGSAATKLEKFQKAVTNLTHLQQNFDFNIAVGLADTQVTAVQNLRESLAALGKMSASRTFTINVKVNGIENIEKLNSFIGSKTAATGAQSGVATSTPSSKGGKTVSSEKSKNKGANKGTSKKGGATKLTTIPGTPLAKNTPLNVVTKYGTLQNMITSNAQSLKLAHEAYSDALTNWTTLQDKGGSPEDLAKASKRVEALNKQLNKYTKNLEKYRKQLKDIKDKYGVPISKDDKSVATSVSKTSSQIKKTPISSLTKLQNKLTKLQDKLKKYQGYQKSWKAKHTEAVNKGAGSENQALQAYNKMSGWADKVKETKKQIKDVEKQINAIPATPIVEESQTSKAAQKGKKSAPKQSKTVSGAQKAAQSAANVIEFIGKISKIEYPKDLSINLTGIITKIVSQVESPTVAVNGTVTNSVSASTTGTAVTNAANKANTSSGNKTPASSRSEAAKEKAARKQASSIALQRGTRKAIALRSQLEQQLWEYVGSESELKKLIENRKYFQKAAQKTGINYGAASNSERLSYLTEVSNQMSANGVMTPWALRKHQRSLIKEIEKEEAAAEREGMGGGGGGLMPRKGRDWYTRMRKALYPFTGNTSFGARTPMAVDMAKGMGTMFAIGGAMSGLSSSVGQAIEYQNTMKTAQAILKNSKGGYNDKAFANMEHTVRNVGVKTKFSAPEVANAARFMAMAGYGINDVNAAIRPIADIALIGDTDLGETADKLTNVMSTFGKDPAKMREVADIMATTFTRSNTDMMMLAESAKYAGGIANMYGRNYKNTFSDTMALFGILGNAGIQASSAGTTVRMMYQNLMKPNKNQIKALKEYGITTRDKNGLPLELVDIIQQIANIKDKNKIPDAVGSIFRITAQPGAANLALHIDDVLDLIKANRAAAGSNISGQIAEEKQNTIQGLWAQVTSTFTEGVVKAFEDRQGGWAGMLMKLRDFLAKPGTVETISSLVDMFEELVKIIARFASFWAKAYSMFKPFVNAWMYVQLVITQIGYLATPFIQLASVFQRLKEVTTGAVAAEEALAAKRAADSVTANVSGNIAKTPYTGTPLLNARNTHNGIYNTYGMIPTPSWKSGQAGMYNLLAGAGLMPMNGRGPLASSVNPSVSKWSKFKGWSGFAGMKNSFNIGKSLSFASGASTLGSLFSPIFSGLAEAVGALLSPVGLASAGIVGLGAALYTASSQMQETKEQTEKLIKAGEHLLEDRNQRLSNWNEAGVEAGGLVTKQVGYQLLSESQGTKKQFSLQDTDFGRGDISGIYDPSVLYNKYTKNVAEYLPSDYIKKYQDYASSSHVIASGGGLNINSSGRGQLEYTQKLAAISAWANQALNDNDIRQAQNDIVKELYTNHNERAARAIIARFAPTGREQRMSDIEDYQDIKNLSNAQDYYEFKNAQYKFLQSMLGTNSAYKTQEQLIKNLSGIKPNQSISVSDFNQKWLDQLIGSVTVHLNNMYGQLTTKDGLIDWEKFEQIYNKGNIINQEQRMEILGQIQTQLQNDPKISQFSNLLKLLGVYLPAIANNRLPQSPLLNVSDTERTLADIRQRTSVQGLANLKKRSQYLLNNHLATQEQIYAAIKTDDQSDAVKSVRDYLHGKSNTINGKDANPDVPSSYNNGKGNNNNTSGKNQKDYQSSYDRSASRPTQVIINIDKLASFSDTKIAKNSDEKSITNEIENRIAEAVSMLASTYLTAATAQMSQMK